MSLSSFAIYLNIFILSNVLCPIVLGETGCPPPEDILPCTCRDRPTPRLECVNITTNGDLTEVFNNSERYTFQEVHIISSAFQYLPHGILEIAAVNELYLQNCTLVSLFDDRPNGSLLYKLHIENTRIQRMKLGTLQYLTKLKSLYIAGIAIRIIDVPLTENIPNSLQEISFVRTETEIIKPAFHVLRNLDKVVVTSSKLKNISRDVFPSTFYGRFIYLDNNNIEKIPVDLFNSMPNLQLVSMRNNRLSEIPQSAFPSRFFNVPFVRLEGNPLKCNCLLVWLIIKKPEYIGGSCISPKNLLGRKLQDLRPGDFNC